MLVSLAPQDQARINEYLYGQGAPPSPAEVKKYLESAPKEIQDVLDKYRARGNTLDLISNAATTYGTGNYAGYQQQTSRSIAGQQQQTLLQNQLKTADEFRRNLPQYISEEAGTLKKSLASQLAEARGQIKANENARGMLYSGRRQKSEGQAGLRAQAAYTQGVGDISSAAEKASSAMAANPLKSQANLQEAQQAQNQYLADSARARQSAAQNLQAGYMGMIGQGIGSYYGSKDSKTP